MDAQTIEQNRLVLLSCAESPLIFLTFKTCFHNLNLTRLSLEFDTHDLVIIALKKVNVANYPQKTCLRSSLDHTSCGLNPSCTSHMLAMNKK